MINISEHGRLKCMGKNIVDKDGKNFLLKGFGLGGWLVPEGYMLKTQAPSPSTIYQAIKELIPNDVDDFFKEYHNNYVNEKDIQKLSELPINSIRVPFNYRMLSNEDRSFKEEGFAIIERIHEWCAKYGLYLILDMHCSPGSQNGQNISDDLSGEPRLYTENETFEPWCIEIWKEIARRYKDSDVFAGYDLINEPVLYDKVPKEDLLNSFKRITRAVREIDKTHLIFIEGDWYSTDFTGLEEKFDDNQVYAFHKYWNESNLKTIQKFLDLRDKTDCPLWLGETGENSNQWIYENVKLMEENNIGWNFWTHKKIETITAPYSIKMTQGYKIIKDYWLGTRPKPTPMFAKKALFEQVDLFKIEKCDYLKDVLNAIFFHKEEPYEINKLDEKIQAAKFDIGFAGSTYHKRLVKREEMQVYDGLNRGNCFRNDSINIINADDGLAVSLVDEAWIRYTLVNPANQISISAKGEGVLLVNQTSVAISSDEKTIFEVNIEKDNIIKLTVKEGSLFIYDIIASVGY